MSPTERHALLVAAAVLVLASAVRAVALRGRPEPAVAADPSAEVAPLLLESRRRAAAEERRRTPLAPGERIDANRAPAQELERIPGIGPALARAIVEERERGGAFLGPEDLVRVPGIGPKTRARVAPYLEFNPWRRPVPRSAPPPLPPGSVLLSRARTDSAPVLDLNRASAQELATLPGLGPARAQAIVEARKARGGFRNVEEIEDVPGIGPATLERVRPRLVVGRRP